MSSHPPIDEFDLTVIARQLGRERPDRLHPAVRVAARCPWQLPAVVESLPYDLQGRPFPTLFYLTCPSARAAVSALEAQGGVRRFGEAALDPESSASIAAATRYERRRRAALARGPAATGAARARDGGAVLRSGIGGVRTAACLTESRRSAAPASGPETGAARLKCLHAHAAHALARPGYAFGELILQEAERSAGSLWCADARCARAAAPPPPAAAGEGRLAASTPDEELEHPIKVAVVDLGTNTCRLLLARATGSSWKPLAVHERCTRVVRLGEGVDRTGRLSAAARERTFVCLEEYARRIDAFTPCAAELNATSVLRDASDGVAFLDRVRSESGLPWRVLSGPDEGALAFQGAVCGLPDLAGDVLVVDIGGGSTEVIVGRVRASDWTSGPDSTAAGEVSRRCASIVARSVDVGAVRLTERFFAHDPPLVSEWAVAVRHVRGVLRRLDMGAAPAPSLGVGVAGSIATLVANKLGLREFRSDLVDGQPLRLADIVAAIDRFRRLTSRRRLLLPGIQPGREDVILAGALIAREVCLRFCLPGLRCSESDILEGAALDLARRCRIDPAATS